MTAKIVPFNRDENNNIPLKLVQKIAAALPDDCLLGVNFTYPVPRSLAQKTENERIYRCDLFVASPFMMYLVNVQNIQVDITVNEYGEWFVNDKQIAVYSCLDEFFNDDFNNLWLNHTSEPINATPYYPTLFQENPLRNIERQKYRVLRYLLLNLKIEDRVDEFHHFFFGCVLIPYASAKTQQVFRERPSRFSRVYTSLGVFIRELQGIDRRNRNAGKRIPEDIYRAMLKELKFHEDRQDHSEETSPIKIEAAPAAQKNWFFGIFRKKGEKHVEV